jgi:hypothetical protein
MSAYPAGYDERGARWIRWEKDLCLDLLTEGKRMHAGPTKTECLFAEAEGV